MLAGSGRWNGPVPPIDSAGFTVPSPLTAPWTRWLTARPRLPEAERQRKLATISLIGVTAVWGSTFVVFKGPLSRMPAADFLALRFWIAAIVLAVLSPASALRISGRHWRHGALLGLAYGGGQVLQAVGLERTSATVSGFLTGAYVVLTPLLSALLLRRHVTRSAWAAVALATAGMALISLRGFSIGTGETLTLLSTAFFALHILGLGSWSRPGEAHQLAVTQMTAVAVTCTIAAIPGGFSLPARTGDWLILIYMALFGGALALVVQTWAQAHLPPTRAAVIMTTEPVWAGVFAVTIGGDHLTWRLLTGGAIVLAGMYVAELRPAAPPPQVMPAEPAQ